MKPEATTKTEDLHKQLLGTATDIKYAKSLAHNEKKVRDKALKSLRKWLEARSRSTSKILFSDLLILWKGLFNSMWMSDKLLIQEECAENIASLIHHLSVDEALLYFKAGMRTLINEWFGIDQLRLEKFFMFVRRLFRQVLVVLKEKEWNVQLVKRFGQDLSTTVLEVNSNHPHGLVIHFTDIYMEEIAKIAESAIKNEILNELLAPFVRLMTNTGDIRIVRSIIKSIFHYLIRQSDTGVKFTEKFDAWKSLGFPGGNIDALTRVENGDHNGGDDEMDEDEHRPGGVFDPRAGSVDVVLPQIKFSPRHVAHMIKTQRFNIANGKIRREVNRLIDNLEELAKGSYPFGLKKVDIPQIGNEVDVTQSAQRLLEFDSQLKQGNVELDQGGEVKTKNNKFDKKRRDRDISLDAGDDVVKTKRMKLDDDDGGSMMKPAKLKNKKAKQKESPGNDSLNKSIELNDEFAMLEGTFLRNSGLWFVYNQTSEVNKLLIEEKTDEGAVVNATTSNNKLTSKQKSKNNNFLNKSAKKINLTNGSKCDAALPICATSSPLATTATQKLQAAAAAAVFPVNEWDVPLQEGEYEFYTPIAKKPSLAALNRRALKAKNRPRRCASSSGKKKVKIDLGMNTTQEMEEHEALLQRSPAIPFDANARPTKPLLKPNAVAGPINPFYKRKHSVKQLI